LGGDGSILIFVTFIASERGGVAVVVEPLVVTPLDVPGEAIRVGIVAVGPAALYGVEAVVVRISAQGTIRLTAALLFITILALSTTRRARLTFQRLALFCTIAVYVVVAIGVAFAFSPVLAVATRAALTVGIGSVLVGTTAAQRKIQKNREANLDQKRTFHAHSPLQVAASRKS
jgi:hypothetical protein